ncbi:MAG TPA: hypothetical protein GX515_07125 [Firmicutes bacterium]|nr:hypothetical protein [Bacillota bacterium]
MGGNGPGRSTDGRRRKIHLGIWGMRVWVLAALLGGLAVPMRFQSGVAEAGPPSYLLQYDIKKGETLWYQVLISETIYSGTRRMTNLYREDVKVESAATADGKIHQTVTCAGTVTPEGGEARNLEPFRYYLTLERTGRILEAEGLKPWDGRQVETLWLAQVILPARPVIVGEKWTVNDELYSTANGGLAMERRTYEFDGIERVGSQDAFKVKYEASRKGRANSRDYTYTGTGTFYLSSGRLAKLEASEMVTYAGNGQDTKVITMIQVNLVK